MKIDRLIPLERQPGSVLLALLGWGEARGEGPLGILAVMWVAKNRSDRRLMPLESVILQPMQFSCFNKSDPNRDRLLMADKDEPISWGQCSALAEVLLAGHTTDPTNGASHYYALSMPAPPNWVKGWRETAVIGGHVFGVAA